MSAEAKPLAPNRKQKKVLVQRWNIFGWNTVFRGGQIQD